MPEFKFNARNDQNKKIIPKIGRKVSGNVLCVKLSTKRPEKRCWCRCVVFTFSISFIGIEKRHASTKKLTVKFVVFNFKHG